jgi:hypothetical protein
MTGPRPGSGDESIGSGAGSLARDGAAASSGADHDDESGWREIHRQMFDPTIPLSGFGQWKVMSTVANVARSYASSRNRALRAWEAKHGTDRNVWPVPHPPVVLWIPDRSVAGCLRCLWIDACIPIPAAVAMSARHHAAQHLPPGDAIPALLARPIRIWCRDAPEDPPGDEFAD